jgi:hypothetical protein
MAWKLLWLAPVLLVGILAPPALAELHTWVDADGQRHYADRPPAVEEQGSQRLDLKSPGTVETVRPDMPAFSMPVDGSDNQADTKRTERKEQRSAELSSDRRRLSCREKWRAWRKSRACFRECGRELHDGTFNNAGCGHCRDRIKPHCMPRLHR